MRNLNEANLTDAVLAKLEGASDARFKEIGRASCRERVYSSV